MKEKIKVAVMGLPKKSAWTMAEAITNSKDMELVPVSLTDSKTLVNDVTVGGVPIRLFTAEKRKSMLFGVKVDVVVDCMDFQTIQQNIGFYDQNNLPFVVGTALDTPPLTEEVVAFQLMKDFIHMNPELSASYSLKVAETNRSVSFKFTRNVAKETLGIIRSFSEKEAGPENFSIPNQKSTRHEPRNWNRRDDGRRY